MTTTKRRPPRRLTLAQRVLLLEQHCDGLIAQCQVELDTRLKVLERAVARIAREAKR